MRLRPYYCLALFSVLFSQCDSDSSPSVPPQKMTFEYTGIVTDELSGLAVSGVDIYACPNVIVKNGETTIRTKKLKTTTDECGYFELSIPEEEAGFSLDGVLSDAPIVIFQNTDYGENIVTMPIQSGDYAIDVRRPVFDSLRWSFDEAGSTLTIDVKRNEVPYLTYNSQKQQEEVIASTSTILFEYSFNGNTPISDEITDVSPDTWESFDIANVPTGQTISVTLKPASISSKAPKVTIQIGANDRTSAKVNVLPSSIDLCN